MRSFENFGNVTLLAIVVRRGDRLEPQPARASPVRHDGDLLARRTRPSGARHPKDARSHETRRRDRHASRRPAYRQ